MTNIDQAAAKLDTALKRLEGNLEAVFERSGDPGVVRREVEALTLDRARLAEELDASLARENELQKLADEASAALGSAIAEVRAALERQAVGDIGEARLFLIAALALLDELDGKPSAAADPAVEHKAAAAIADAAARIDALSARLGATKTT